MTDLTLVPPQRLGALLCATRSERAMSLADLSHSSAGRWTPTDLEHIERGSVALSDTDVTAISALYGVESGLVVPQRNILMVDMHEGRLGVGETSVKLDSREIDAVLERYLSLLYLLRNLEPGTELTLRDRDLDVLSGSLHHALADVERRLGQLMLGSSVEERTRLLGRRISVPMAGLLVAVTAVGSLVLVNELMPSAPISPGHDQVVALPAASDTTASLSGARFGTIVDNAVGSTSSMAPTESLAATDLTPSAGPEPTPAPRATPEQRNEPEPSANPTPTPWPEQTSEAIGERPSPSVWPTATAIPSPEALPSPANALALEGTTAPVEITTPMPWSEPRPTAAPIAVSAATTAFAALGAEAEAIVGYDWQSVLPGWTIRFEGDSLGYRGLTNTSSRSIAIYINPGDDANDVAGVLAHEIAHAIDVEYLDSSNRQAWLTARGMPLQWWPGSGLNDFAVGAGDFAEAVAAHLTGSESNSEYGAFTAEQLQLAASFLP